jgi:predicted nuclease of predicted toxin-antitoxin system
MWLLDVNIPLALKAFLKQKGITAETAEERGWRQLENGDLVSSAATAGYQCLLTRDRRFALSARKTLKKFPGFSVVIIRLLQMKEPLYFDAFETAWAKRAVTPIPGKVIEWPETENLNPGSKR